MKPAPKTVYNNGFDDSLGGYISVPHDHIAYRYEILKRLGKGKLVRRLNWSVNSTVCVVTS